MLVYEKYECFIMQMLYVCVLCASCGSSQCYIRHDMQFVNAGRVCERPPYVRGILQSQSHNCLEYTFVYPIPILLFTPSHFILYACTEM